MFEISGKYNKAKVFSDEVDANGISQIIQLLNQPFCEGEKIRIMPDVHAGVGSVVGTTMTISDKIVPNLVGRDIGCGMEAVYLDAEKIDFEKLDDIIRRFVPFGYENRETPHKFMKNINLADLNCYFRIEAGSQGNFALGSLGRGNHFIELEKTKENELILVVHSGSRRIGADVCEYYQNQALKAFKRRHKFAQSKDLIYCEGKLFEDYIHDMQIMQEFALWNRKAIIETILSHLGIGFTKSFTTVHNYIDLDKMILRKGAVSAKRDEKLIIPINMRDGSLICKGKGNSDWNYSAPHGAGRLLNRRKARESISIEEFEDSMKSVYSTSVSEETIDEAPMAYKPLDSIIDNISDTVKILDIAKPIYNFKA